MALLPCATLSAFVGAALLLSARVEAGNISITRSRTAENVELPTSIFISVYFDIADLPHGAGSTVRFESPQGEIFVCPAKPDRGTRYWFGSRITRPLASIAGNWKITVVEGTATHHHQRVQIPALTAADFPAWRPFPVFSYQGDPRKVLLPWESGGTSRASISGISGSTYNASAGGRIYTIPEGGPYNAVTSDTLTLPAITVTDAADQPLYTISSAVLHSESLTRFYSSQDRPFANQCMISGDMIEVDVSGLTVGNTYLLQSSADCVTWNDLHTFVAVANAHFHRESRGSTTQFFRVKTVE